jgi:hypothetical protein
LSAGAGCGYGARGVAPRHCEGGLDTTCDEPLDLSVPTSPPDMKLSTTSD